MNTIFSIIDELALTPEAKQAGTRTAFQEEMMGNYKTLPTPHLKAKMWNKILKISPKGSEYHLAPKPGIVKNDSNGKQPLGSGKVLISENTIELFLDKDLIEQGVILCSIEDAQEKFAAIFNSVFDGNTNNNEDKLSTFTAALSQHGFLFYVPKNVSIKEPIEIVISNSSKEMVLPLLALTKLEEGANASMILRIQSNPEKDCESIVLVNNYCRVGNNAKLRILETQSTGKNDWNFNHNNISLENDADLDILILEKGGKVNKRTFSTDLLGEGGNAAVTGIYEPRKGQYFVYDTFQNHKASHTTSDLLFNGVLRDDAYSLWKGNIYVEEGTKGTDGFQVNNNMLLNEEVQVESIPGLEIIADEVRCTHAVTLKTVDAEQLFYLKSRGIELEVAQEMIISGFLEEAAMRMDNEKLLEIAKDELK